MVKSNSGKVSITGTNIFTMLKFSGEPTITSNIITFSNPLAFNITLQVFKKKKNKLQNVYYYELDAGDVLNDSTPYILEEGDYLKATCNITGTDFLIQMK